jgi:hypothetical protein
MPSAAPRPGAFFSQIFNAVEAQHGGIGAHAMEPLMEWSVLAVSIVLGIGTYALYCLIDWLRAAA